MNPIWDWGIAVLSLKIKKDVFVWMFQFQHNASKKAKKEDQILNI